MDLSADDTALLPGPFSELAERLHAEATRAGRETVATGMTRLFGRMDCPSCGTRFSVADHLAGSST